MQADRASVLRELEVQLELDDHRGCAPFAGRVRAVAQAGECQRLVFVAIRPGIKA
jgi:hypothetical protein